MNTAQSLFRGHSKAKQEAIAAQRVPPSGHCAPLSRAGWQPPASSMPSAGIDTSTGPHLEETELKEMSQVSQTQ